MAAIVLGLLVVGEGARRLALSRSLYKLNLNAEAEMSEMPPPAAGERIVVFAPHPDDETLGAGGYIQQAVAAGAHVRVVLMTNGEYEQFAAMLFDDTIIPRTRSFVDLGYTRQREVIVALDKLGVPVRDVVFLGYPNAYLDQMWLPGHWSADHPVRSSRTGGTRSPYGNSFSRNATYCGESVVRDIRALLLREVPDVVVAVHPHDLHRDHWATYGFVRFALQELAAGRHAFARRCRVYCYLIHRSHWPAPRRYKPWLRLEPPGPLAASSETHWLALPLTVAQTLRKRQAALTFLTQGGALDPTLSCFARTNELFGVPTAHKWPARDYVPLTRLIRDPAADIDTAARNPRADIVSVSLGRIGRQLLCRIHLRARPSPKVGYHLSIHAGGEDPSDRLIAQYDWTGRSRKAQLFAHGTLRQLPLEDLETDLETQATSLVTPWPLADDKHTFFMVRAWTTRGRRIVDQTAEVSVSLAASNQAVRP